jgi:hypothetical protein
VDVDDDAVVLEGDMRVVGVDVARRGGVTAHVITTVAGVKELGAEGPFQCLAGDIDLNGVCI